MCDVGSVWALGVNMNRLTRLNTKNSTPSKLDIWMEVVRAVYLLVEKRQDSRQAFLPSCISRSIVF
jgi:hypothetical protein